MNNVHTYMNKPEEGSTGVKHTEMGVDKVILSAVRKLADPVIATMGANGTYHAFYKTDNFGNFAPEITNDGVTVAGSLFPLEDSRENLFASYIYGAAQKTSLIAGDGTTRTISTIDSLTKSLIGNIKNPYRVQEGIDTAVKLAVKYVEKNKRKVNLNTIWKIAHTSSHGNKEIANNIKALYKQLKDWTIDISFEDGDWEDTYALKEGYRIGTKSPSITSTCPPKIIAPRLILFNDKLTDFGILTRNIHIRVQKDASPVIFLVKDITPDMITLAKTSKGAYNIDIYIVKIDTFGYEVEKQFQDIQYLATVQEFADMEFRASTNKILNETSKMTQRALAHMEDPAPSYEIKIKSALLTNEECIFEFDTPRNAVEDYLKNVIYAEQYEDKELQYAQQKRAKRLKAINCTYYVGGNSPEDIQTKKYLVEDALLACRSAIRKGFVPGGGWFDIQLSNYLEQNTPELDDEALKGYNAIIESLRYGLRLMCVSGHQNYDEIYKAYSTDKQLFNFSTFKYEDKDESSVVDSASTLLEVLNNSQSVINHFVKTKSLTF